MFHFEHACMCACVCVCMPVCVTHFLSKVSCCLIRASLCPRGTWKTGQSQRSHYWLVGVNYFWHSLLPHVCVCLWVRVRVCCVARQPKQHLIEPQDAPRISNDFCCRVRKFPQDIYKLQAQSDTHSTRACVCVCMEWGWPSIWNTVITLLSFCHEHEPRLSITLHVSNASWRGFTSVYTGCSEKRCRHSISAREKEKERERDKLSI